MLLESEGLRQEGPDEEEDVLGFDGGLDEEDEEGWEKAQGEPDFREVCVLFCTDFLLCNLAE